MSRWSSPALQWALMVLISAFLCVGFFRLKSFLFAALEHTKAINWIFLPAGFRVLLVLMLELPGAAGIALGTCWLNGERLDDFNPLSNTAVCLASGFGPWVVKRGMEQFRQLDRELTHISSTSLLEFVLFYAAVNAVSHQAIYWGFSMADSQPWIDVWPMFIGDTLGALLVLYSFKLGLPWLKNLAHSRL